MPYLLLSPSGVPITGDRLADVTIFGSAPVRLDAQLRCVLVNGTPDGVTFGHDYDDVELVRQAADRALVLLKRRGYTLYQTVS